MAAKKLRNDQFSTGKGRALRAAALGGPSCDAQLSPALNRVSVALAKGGPRAAALQLEREMLDAPPERRRELYEASVSLIDQALAQFEPLSKKDSRQVIVSLGHAARLAGPEAIQDFAGRLAGAIARQGVGDFDDGLQSLVVAGGSPEVALATAEELRRLGKTEAADAIEAAVFHGIEQLTGEVTEAADQQAELEARLAQDMAQFGGSMTAEERQRYEDAFWSLPEHAAVKEKAERLSARLSQQLEAVRPAMEAAAIAGNELAGEKLLDGYEALARFPQHAEQAIGWVSDLGANTALFERIDGFTSGSLEDRLSDGLMTDATRSLQTRLLAEFADEPDGQRLLFEKMKEIYGHFKLAKRLPGLAKDVAALLEGTERFVNGSPQHLESIAEGFANGSRFQKAATIFSLAAGIYGTANALSDGRYLEALKKGLGTSEAGLELTAGLLNAYSSAAGASSDAAKFLGRFAPALGMVLDAIQLGEDLNELRNDPNAGELVKAVGTLLQLGGDIAGYVPVAGTLVDGILTVGGSLIHAIGDFVDSIIEGNEERDALRREQAELLATATGMPAELAGELVRSSSTTFQRLRAMGFGPAEIRALATDPKVDLSSDEFGYALKTAALFGLSPEDTKAFLELTLHRGEFGYAGTPLTQVVLPLDQPQGDWTLRNTPEGQQEYLQFVQNDVLASFSGYGDIVEFLRTHRGTPDWDTVGIDTPFDV